jgi:hypothetical protein
MHSARTVALSPSYAAQDAAWGYLKHTMHMNGFELLMCCTIVHMEWRARVCVVLTKVPARK